MQLQEDLWDIKHKNHYSGAEWLLQPNPLAKTFLEYVHKNAIVLELGCGQGQDTEFLAHYFQRVTSIDFSENAVRATAERLKGCANVQVFQHDMREPFPFEDGAFDGVYSHLSLHYFTSEVTKTIVQEIARVLRPKGIVCLCLNTTKDPEVHMGKVLEQNFYEMPNGFQKRFFSTDTVEEFFQQKFQTLLVDEKGETIKDALIADYGLIRYLGERRDEDI